MDSLNEIGKALAAAQMEMQNPKFDSQNPHFKNRFASLASVRNAVVPCLAKHGISLTQDLTTVEGGVACKTILTHASGQQMIFGPLIMPAQGNSQVFGSAGSYCKRYSMMAVAAVVGDEDDDAEAAVGRKPELLNGLPKIDPRGEGYKSADMVKAKEYAERFRGAMTSGNENLMFELHAELNPEPDFYVAVSTLLTPAERKTIKESIHRVNQAHKNGATKQ
jgi:hypothetical protein